MYDPFGLIGTPITVWDGGVGHAATVTELDFITGKNLLKVKFTDAAREDAWIERWRLKQATRVQAATEANAKWQQADAPPPAAKASKKPKRSVRMQPLPNDGEGAAVPFTEWRSGVRPKPKSASTTEQVDGVWVTRDADAGTPSAT